MAEDPPQVLHSDQCFLQLDGLSCDNWHLCTSFRGSVGSSTLTFSVLHAVNISSPDPDMQSQDVTCHTSRPI